MKCEKCGCTAHAIYIEMPMNVGWRTYCVPCFVEYQRDSADTLADYLDMKLNEKERKAEQPF